MTDLKPKGLTDNLLIKDFNHFGLYLFRDQAYLGTSVLYAKRAGFQDLFRDPTPHERGEFFEIGRNFEHALQTFMPSSVDYHSSRNVNSGFHLYIVPRYNQKREFAGMTFEPQNIGRHYQPFKSNKVDKSIRDKIIDALRDAMA